MQKTKHTKATPATKAKPTAAKAAKKPAAKAAPKKVATKPAAKPTKKDAVSKLAQAVVKLATKKPAAKKAPAAPVAPKLALSIFGANLPSAMQRKGQFHVHLESCADCAKIRKDAARLKFPEYKEQHATAESVARSIFADQIREGCTVPDALAEIYFAPCVVFATGSGEAVQPAVPAGKGEAIPPPPAAMPIPTPHAAPVPQVPPPAPAPKPAPKKRYESKTDPSSKYHNRERSTIVSPVAVVWGLCDSNPGVARKDIIKMAISMGVSPNTASTQYSFWKKNKADKATAAAALQLPLPGVGGGKRK